MEEYYKKILIPNENLYVSGQEKIYITYGKTIDSSKKIYNNKDTKKYKKNKKLFSFNGKKYNNRRLVIAVIKEYIRKNPKTTIEDLEEVFPKNIQGTYGIFKRIENISDKDKGNILNPKTGKKYTKRYITDDVIELIDGTKIMVCSQWRLGKNGVKDNLDYFIDNIKDLGFIVTLV